MQTPLRDLSTAIQKQFRMKYAALAYSPRGPPPYSHSIVPGGLLVTSYTTRFTPLTSLMIRVAVSPRNFMSKEHAVMPSHAHEWTLNKGLASVAEASEHGWNLHQFLDAFSLFLGRVPSNVWVQAEYEFLELIECDRRVCVATLEFVENYHDPLCEDEWHSNIGDVFPTIYQTFTPQPRAEFLVATPLATPVDSFGMLLRLRIATLPENDDAGRIWSEEIFPTMMAIQARVGGEDLRGLGDFAHPRDRRFWKVP